MTVKSGGTWSGVIVTKDATGALSAASVGPVGALYVDGVANGAGVTVTGANPYKWTVTLPALTAGQCVSMYITATVATIATASVVAEDVADTARISDVSAKTDYLPSVAAGASGGVFIAGANAATSVATALTANITGNLSGSVGSVAGAVGSVTGAVGSVTGNVGGNVTGSVGSLATQAKADVNAEVVDAVATDIIADSIPADGSRPTIAQALYMLTQFMNERSVSSTTVTVKKVDGSTALYTLTLNDAGTPTAITRAT